MICQTGAKPSEPDGRDILTSGIIPEIKRRPTEFLPPFDLTITNQGSSPSCVGHSMATLKQYNEFKERNDIEFDGDWIYKEAKKIDGIPDFDGTYLRTGMKVLKDSGAKPMYGASDPSMYRIGAYARIDNLTLDSIKNHILVYGTAIAGFYGSNEGWQGKTVRPPKAGETVWGHCVTLIGYGETYLIGKNHWGEDRHDKGFFKIPAGYMPFESWIALSDMPNEVLTADDGGWVASDFINWINGKLVTTYRLNVREEPTTNGIILKTLEKGAEVKLLDEQSVANNGYTWRHIQLV